MEGDRGGEGTKEVWFTVEHEGRRIAVPWSALDRVNRILIDAYGRYLTAEDVEQLIRDQIAQGRWPGPEVE